MSGSHPTDAVREMSFHEWATMDEDEPGEWLDGRLVEEEAPDATLEIVVVWFTALLHAWCRPRGGFVGGSDAKFAVSARRGRKPDLWAFFTGRRKPPRHGVIRVPPDLAVEVVTATPRDARRDRVEKLDEYASFGIRYYWIVDPELRAFEILELESQGRYSHALGATAGRIESVPGCDGLTIDLDALWAEIDELSDEPV